VLLLLLVVGPAGAHGPEAASALLQQDLESGRIDADTYYLQSFRLAFAPERVDDRYAGDRLPPCFTSTIERFREAAGTLSAATVEEIEGYLAPRPDVFRSTYISPSGIFELHYETTGINAVPPDDVNPANGIPDYVEMCAEFYDTTWQTVIDAVGFYPPNLPTDGTYDCYFEALTGGLLGYTAGLSAGRSQITIDNDFLGFGMPPSNDPDGPQAGRAKGVISHEFKHASQWTQIGLEPGYWKELDANWVMEVVFDESNIYHAWLGAPYNSQLNHPEVRLDDGGSGNYEDFLWETYLSESYGNQIIVDFAARRAAFPAESVVASYQAAQQLYGTNWGESYPAFMEWCWFTGSRAQPPFGFEEATDMMRMNLLQSAISAYPWSGGGNVDQMSAHHRRFNKGIATGYPRVIFDGDDTFNQFVVSVIASNPDGSFTIVHPPLDANQVADYTVPQIFPNLAYVGVIVTNTNRTQGTKSYTLQVLDEPGAVGVDVGPAVALRDVVLQPGAPNPFRERTVLRYSVPAQTTGNISIYDVNGRLVRTLVRGELAAGPGEVAWDGRDSDGGRVPAGVYWARIWTPDGSAGRKVSLLH